MSEIRIDELPVTVLPSTGHSFPAIKDGLTVQLTVGQVVDLAKAAIVDGSPDLLNTLDELSAALGDDENFSTTVTNLLSQKARLDGGNVFTGNQTIDGSSVVKLSDFLNLLSSSGYCKLPNGLIIQWGNDAGGGAADKFISLPIAFPNAHFLTIPSMQGTASTTLTAVVTADTFGLTNFIVRPRYVVASAVAHFGNPIQYISIGY